MNYPINIDFTREKDLFRAYSEGRIGIFSHGGKKELVVINDETKTKFKVEGIIGGTQASVSKKMITKEGVCLGTKPGNHCFHEEDGEKKYCLMHNFCSKLSDDKKRVDFKNYLKEEIFDSTLQSIEEEELDMSESYVDKKGNKIQVFPSVDGYRLLRNGYPAPDVVKLSKTILKSFDVKYDSDDKQVLLSELYLALADGKGEILDVADTEIQQD
jgi:hypothetical protein